MNASRQSPARASLLAALAVAPLAVISLPGVALGAEPGDAAEQARQEARRIELESRRLQEQGRRQMQEQTRAQEGALRGQEDAIRRLEEARRRLEESSREVAQLSTQMGRDFTYSFSNSGTPPRAVLGVVLQPADGRGGPVITRVSPGGAAEQAGLKAGDVITHVAGLEVGKDSDPARAVVEKMSQIEPDTRVPVSVLRDGRKMDFEVTARATPVTPGATSTMPANGRPLQVELRNLADNLRAFQGNGQAGGAGFAMNLDPIADRRLFELYDGNRLGGMEFATLSDRLGSYFGVKSGVLVVRAGADAPFGLQDGDVILAIDGREPTNAQHAGRILRSYQPGETVKLRVQRDRKARDLEGALPGRRQN